MNATNQTNWKIGDVCFIGHAFLNGVFDDGDFPERRTLQEAETDCINHLAWLTKREQEQTTTEIGKCRVTMLDEAGNIVGLESVGSGPKNGKLDGYKGDVYVPFTNEELAKMTSQEQDAAYFEWLAVRIADENEIEI